MTFGFKNKNYNSLVHIWTDFTEKKMDQNSLFLHVLSWKTRILILGAQFLFLISKSGPTNEIYSAFMAIYVLFFCVFAISNSPQIIEILGHLSVYTIYMTFWKYCLPKHIFVFHLDYKILHYLIEHLKYSCYIINCLCPVPIL